MMSSGICEVASGSLNVELQNSQLEFLSPLLAPSAILYNLAYSIDVSMIVVASCFYRNYFNDVNSRLVLHF
jgi:hypothetical protein